MWFLYLMLFLLPAEGCCLKMFQFHKDRAYPILNLKIFRFGCRTTGKVYPVFTDIPLTRFLPSAFAR